jgi:hypothetical protein
MNSPVGRFSASAMRWRAKERAEAASGSMLRRRALKFPVSRDLISE